MRIGRTISPAAAPISLKDILNGLWGFTNGQREIERFQNELKAYFQVKHCFLISSGKAALTIILKALHEIYPERDEVLIPAFTCYSVPSAIVRAGLKVRACDVDPTNLDFDFHQLQDCLESTDRILAIVCPHLFGIPVDIDKVRSLIPDPGISIIEDAAQAMGGVTQSQYLGTLGDVGFFSLGRGKPYSTVHGGIVLTDSDQIAGEVNEVIGDIGSPSGIQVVNKIIYALVISALIRPSLYWLPKSVPGLKIGETIFDPEFPIQVYTTFQAGLARNWQERINLFQDIRRENVLFWQRTLKNFSWLELIPFDLHDQEIIPLLRFPVLIRDSSLRAELLEVSHRHGLGIMHTYPDSIDAIDKLELQGSMTNSFSGSRACANQLVTFPVHSLVTEVDRQQILDCLKRL